MSRADRFLKACRREPVDCTPVWMMRQAGRYLPEYREIRKKHTFLEMCKTPEVAAEVTIQPVRRYPIDAAIIFADILLPLEPMGIGLEFAKGEGPVIHNPVRTMADVEKLKHIDAATQIDYLMKAIKIVLKELAGTVPLIGFTGAPFTLASYIIEGGGSRNYEHAKAMMFAEPKTWHKLMEHLSSVIINYLNAQIDTGVQAVQIFDSWVGALGPSDYREFVLPHQKNVIAGIKKAVPIIHFAHGATHLLEMVWRPAAMLSDSIGAATWILRGNAWGSTKQCRAISTRSLFSAPRNSSEKERRKSWTAQAAETVTS